MAKVEYPKWVYSPTKGASLCKTVEDNKSLGAGWYESPADFPKNSGEANVPVAAAPAPAPVVVPKVPETVLAAVAAAEDAMKKFFAAPAKIISDRVTKIDSFDELVETRDIEEQRPGGPRKTVLKAIADRLAELQTPAEPVEA